MSQVQVQITDINARITDIKLILSRIETTAINDAHMVPPLVAQANEELDRLYEFFNPGEDDETAANTAIDMMLGQPAGPTQAGSPADETAEQGQPAEQAADTQEEKPVEQPQAESTEGGGPAQGPA